MDWRKLWSVLSGSVQVLLMLGALLAGVALVYVMALSRMHRH